MTIGELVQQYCLSHGITNQQFAELSHVSKAYVSMLVNNRNPKTGKPPIPTVATYQKIADAMGMSMHDLLALTQNDVPTYIHTVRSEQSDQGTSYRGLADAIVEKLREADDLGIIADDELMRELEAIRRDPERRKLFKRASYSDIDEVRQANAILDALKETKQ